MKEFSSDNLLPVAPSLQNSTELLEIKKIVQGLCVNKIADDLFSSRWEGLLNRYGKWEKSFSGLHTSATNRKLQLYKMIMEDFSDICVKNNEQLLEVILSFIPKLGDKIQKKGGQMEVVRRTISDRFGIILTLKSNAGALINEELFD